MFRATTAIRETFIFVSNGKRVTVEGRENLTPEQREVLARGKDLNRAVENLLRVFSKL